jgi:hypothetical protein
MYGRRLGNAVHNCGRAWLGYDKPHPGAFGGYRYEDGLIRERSVARTSNIQWFGSRFGSFN